MSFLFSRGSSQPWDRTQISLIAGGFFTPEPQEKPKNTGVGSLSLLQWIFLAQESTWGLLHCKQILYRLSYKRRINAPWDHWAFSLSHCSEDHNFCMCHPGMSWPPKACFCWTSSLTPLCLRVVIAILGQPWGLNSRSPSGAEEALPLDRRVPYSLQFRVFCWVAVLFIMRFHLLFLFFV